VSFSKSHNEKAEKAEARHSQFNELGREKSNVERMLNKSMMRAIANDSPNHSRVLHFMSVQSLENRHTTLLFHYLEIYLDGYALVGGR
jgi:hypothetical protein